MQSVYTAKSISTMNTSQPRATAVAVRELARAKGRFTDEHNVRWRIDYAGSELRRRATTTNGGNRLVFIFSVKRTAGAFDRTLNKLTS